MIALTSALAVALLVAVVVVRRRIVVVTVSGISMTPTLRPGEKLLVRRCGLSALKVGDIVVLEPPRAAVSRAGTPWQVKRVAALPGDPIPVSAREASGALRAVPDGALIVLGDNTASDDSRRTGPYPGDRILGVVLRKLAGDAFPGHDPGGRSTAAARPPGGR
ncbi:S26 family signal peptidase [Nonomuraea sp. NPDC048826]|uniref:S26 family signal peptidase n=1 Tax=Nonomuraea sp. NPDC048826 TaxID=3364347 RepID=UPI0037232AB5